MKKKLYDVMYLISKDEYDQRARDNATMVGEEDKSEANKINVSDVSGSTVIVCDEKQLPISHDKKKSITGQDKVRAAVSPRVVVAPDADADDDAFIAGSSNRKGAVTSRPIKKEKQKRKKGEKKTSKPKKKKKENLIESSTKMNMDTLMRKQFKPNLLSVRPYTKTFRKLSTKDKMEALVQQRLATLQGMRPISTITNTPFTPLTYAPRNDHDKSPVPKQDPENIVTVKEVKKEKME